MRTIQFFFLLTICLAVSTNIQAQEDWHWDDYGLGFSLPNGMKVIENDGETFTAEKGDLYLSILPIKDRTVTEDDLADAVVAFADELEYDSITDVDELTLNDLYGYYVEGSKDGAKAVIIALMDVESANNYLAVIVYTKATRNQAIELARSFYAFDE